MTIPEYRRFFKAATGHDPFPYQETLATTAQLPTTLTVPTGTGKTAAVLTAWLWRRFCHGEAHVRTMTPRRLVYCLPMRTLVEQTSAFAEKLVRNLKVELGFLPTTPVHVIMGGTRNSDWTLSPEQEQIVVGTQDMLISAALNRGYGMSRFRWPMAFGLLNNDCLWVMDETQLMGPSLTTSISLETFRKQLGTYGSCHSLWMSATQSEHSDQANGASLELSDRDLAHPVLSRRLSAPKTIFRLSVEGGKDSPLRQLAAKVVRLHEPLTTTIVMVNRVDRAQALYQAISRESGLEAELLLLHSRFRPVERRSLNAALHTPVDLAGRIIVSTQAIEAGVDISSATMITDLAPWHSMIQRMGRCNRYGEFDKAHVYWLDVNDADSQPYSPEELTKSREMLQTLEAKSVSPGDLPKTGVCGTGMHALRLNDVVDLFDTSPDLSGNDIDVSRFIREDGDTDVLLFWREWDGERPPSDMPEPSLNESCSVAVWTVKKFLDSESFAWRWDHLESRWQLVSKRFVRPGMQLLLSSTTGGYDPVLGWTGTKTPPVPVIIASGGKAQEDVAADPLTFSARWQTLAEHSSSVVEIMSAVLRELTVPLDTQGELMTACRWHDAGKAHEVFRQTMAASGEPPDPREVWAKSPSRHMRHRQPYFRHELASALAFLQTPMQMDDESRDLVAYLIAAHHGKVRLSIRSLPGELPPTDIGPDIRIARGVWEGSMLAEACLGGGECVPYTKMDLSIMELGMTEDGRRSWLERTIGLRDRLGPFRLAFLEALVRVADIQASARQVGGDA